MVKKMRDKDSPTFKEATANMTSKEKINYIWEYYKLHILGSIAAIVLVVSIMHTILTQVDTHLHITFLSGFEHTINTLDSVLEREDEQVNDRSGPSPGIWVDFEIIPTLKDLLLDDSAQSNSEIIVQALALNLELIPVFTTHAGAGVIDMIVTYLPDFYAMNEVGHFINISDLGWDIPEHVMHNEYALYLRYFTVFDGYVAPIDELVLGISATTMQIENVEAFFEILLDK